MTKSQELAEKAYRAYGAVTKYKNFQGDPMPAFGELTVQIQAAWACAATTAYIEAIWDVAPKVGRSGQELLHLLAVAEGEAR